MSTMNGYTHHTPSRTNPPSTFRWFLGMGIAATFSLVYILTPLYMLSCIAALMYGTLNPASRTASWLFVSPLILSIISKPKASPKILSKLSPMLDYFQYEEIKEVSDEEARRLIIDEGKTYIFATVPHGVIPYCNMCSAFSIHPDLLGIHTAVASAVLHTPILKNVMGIFGLVDASGPKFRKHIQKKGKDGCIVIYVGGIAELFKSSPKEERLYLKKRKGFIKYALRDGADVVPLYLFGNTSVLTVMKAGPLAKLSRKLQTSLTYFWGKFYLPIPRDEKLLYVRGKPLGMPHIPEPTDEDVNKWHAKYCQEVTRLFETYKEKAPMYKHKKLYID